MQRETFDLLVIGGGVTGCGVALDAATRGLSVALVEQRDYASGTSSRSSKLFHGGLRYLEQRDFGLVREALAERNLMVETLCPHLAVPVSFLYPLRHHLWERLYVGAGILLYEWLAARSSSPLPRHRHLGRSEALRLAPSLRRGGLVGALVYWDVMVDDARHTMTVARTAALHGAALAPSTRVTGLITDRGAVTGARVTDLESGRTWEVRARRVINATGVWSDDIQELADRHGLDVRASKGVHLVVPRDSIKSGTGMILRTEKSVLFVIPWGEHWIIGTTDTPWSLQRAHPAASRSDIEYLLNRVNSALGTPLGDNDIVGVYAGLRPLLAGESDDTSKLSREHAVIEAGGLISIAGGKYTTYRVMARDAVDAAVQGLDRRPGPSRTDSTPLVGADGFRDLWERRDTIDTPLSPDQTTRMLRRYGSLTPDLTDLIVEDRELGERVVADAPYLRAEIVYAVTHEGALHLDDVLTRRTRISIETRHRGTEAAAAVARIMGDRLGWSDATRHREIEHYRARVEAERDSQLQPDDRTADAARMGAPDVRTGTVE